MRPTIRTVLKAALILIVVAIYFGLRNTVFFEIDTFSRDALQHLNFNEPLEKSIVTLNINLENNGVTYPHSSSSMKKIIEKVQSYEPRSIILTMEPLDFDSSFSNKKELFNFLSSQQNLYLNGLNARDNVTNFSSDTIFRMFPRLLNYERCNDSPNNRESRRAMLSIDAQGPNALIDFLQKMNLTPKPIEYFKYGFDYWNSRQAYIKNFQLGRYGYWQTKDMFANQIPKSTFKDKIVIIGTHDHFSFLNARSVLNLFGAKRDGNYNKTRIPAQDVLANVLNFHVTGSYIKFIKNFDDILVFSIVLILLIVSNISLKSRLYIFYSLLPGILVIMAFLYVCGSWYIDFSRSFVVLFGLQYLTIPLVVFNFFKEQQRIQTQAIDGARVEALQSISESVAHDLRSPLSTINLLVTKAKFSDENQKLLVTKSIDRVNTIIDILLTKSSDAGYRKISLEKVDIGKIINEILQEKKQMDERINYVLSLQRSEALADPVEFQRILSNILDNSIFALKGISSPSVTIKVVPQSSYVLIEIIDNGIGIPESVLEILGKERFSTKRPGEGNGIGILQAKRVLMNMAGKLEISSSISKGTMVSISLKSAP